MTALLALIGILTVLTALGLVVLEVYLDDPGPTRTPPRSHPAD